MFKNMKRARRRHEFARMVAKARRVRPWDEEPQRIANNLAGCSCWMCGNPRRKQWLLTLQERRQTLRDQDWARE